MKKFLSVALIASFIFGYAVFLPAMAQEDATSTVATTTVENNGVKANAGDNLEKILSPDQIRFYRNIVKKGMELFGIKKDKMIEKKESIASSTGQELEKIPNPQAIGFFEKIKKIGTALWGYRKGAGEKKEVKRLLVTSETSACVITAIETKDAALAVNNTAFANELNTAIASRTACQKTALGSTENQFDNLDACVKTFKEAVNASRVKVKTAHQTTWKTYRESLAVCAKSASSTGTSTSTEAVSESQGEIIVEDGGGGIVDLASGQ